MRYHVSYTTPRGCTQSGYPLGASAEAVKLAYENMGQSDVVVRELTVDEYRTIYLGI